MKRIILLLIVVLSIAILSACDNEEVIYNFKIRKDDYMISESQSVIVEYKTDELGKLTDINIDRLLSLQEMIYFHPLLDYDQEIEGYDNDVFIEPGTLCTDYDDIMVPLNIEIGNTKFMYVANDCEYQEVDRNNEIKTSTFARSYSLRDTIGVSRDVVIRAIVYDEDSIERFISFKSLPHTVKMFGVYSIAINPSNDGFSSMYRNYYYEMAIYEQLLLKHQDNQLASDEVMGYSMDLNILDLSEITEVTPLINDFNTKYAKEIYAVDQLVELIGVIQEQGTTPEEE